LGIVVRGLAVVEARERGLGERAAVLVTAVSADGRAQRAGLLADDVVLAADGVDVVDAADLEARVRALASAAPLRLTVWRGGRVLDIVVAPDTTGS
jgi:serine protease Do